MQVRKKKWTFIHTIVVCAIAFAFSYKFIIDKVNISGNVLFEDGHSNPFPEVLTQSILEGDKTYLIKHINGLTSSEIDEFIYYFKKNEKILNSFVNKLSTDTNTDAMYYMNSNEEMLYVKHVTVKLLSGSASPTIKVQVDNKGVEEKLVEDSYIIIDELSPIKHTISVTIGDTTETYNYDFITEYIKNTNSPLTEMERIFKKGVGKSILATTNKAGCELFRNGEPMGIQLGEEPKLIDGLEIGDTLRAQLEDKFTNEIIISNLTEMNAHFAFPEDKPKRYDLDVNIVNNIEDKAHGFLKTIAVGVHDKNYNILSNLVSPNLQLNAFDFMETLCRKVDNLTLSNIKTSNMKQDGNSISVTIVFTYTGDNNLLSYEGSLNLNYDATTNLVTYFNLNTVYN